MLCQKSQILSFKKVSKLIIRKWRLDDPLGVMRENKFCCHSVKPIASVKKKQNLLTSIE